MRISEADAVLFDVDGTLVDTTYLHVVCWSEAFAAVGRSVVSAEVHHLIGMDGDLLAEDLLGKDSGLVEEVKERHSSLYKRYWDGLRTLPGARELLEHCHDAGQRVVLASSASGEELGALRTALDADHWLHDTTSSEDADAGKPAADIVQIALDKAGTEPGRAVFVGDAVWDGKAAGAAGVAFVGLTCGGTSATDLRGAGAREVFATPADLLAQVRRG